MRSVVAGCRRLHGLRRHCTVSRRDSCTVHAPCRPASTCAKQVAVTPAEEFRHSKVSALSSTDRMRFWAVALLWLAVNLAFWGWWLHQTQRSTPWLYWAETVARSEERRVGKEGRCGGTTSDSREI